MNRTSRCFSVLLIIAMSTGLPLASQTLLSSTATISRIQTPIDESGLVPLRGNVHPLARAEFDRGPAPASMATGRITLLLGRSAAQQQALEQYLADLQNPSSANFHKWLTPAQYGALYGPSDADVATVGSWLEGHGFKVEKIAQARNAIQFSGTVAGLQNTFHTSIHTFAVGGATHYANVSDPQIPAALAAVVAGVGPLNDFHPKTQIVKGGTGHYDAGTHGIQPDFTLFENSTPYLFMDPADAATIYDTPNTNLNANYASGTTYDGTGVTLGIVGVSDLTLGDVQNYRMAFLGETAGNVNLPTVIVDGDDPGLNGAGVEALLDNEVSGGIAPKAKVYFYTSADTDLSQGVINAVLRALDDNAASILSMSFGECEAGLGTSGNQFFFETAQQAAAQGISETVSAGDNGSAGCDDFDTQTEAFSGLQVSGLASPPSAIAVGGTDFDVLPGSFATYVMATTNGVAPYYRTALNYIPENPWNQTTTVDTAYANDVAYVDSQGNTNIVAGSGGVSSLYSKPSFQTSLTPNDNARDLPDVSFFASGGDKRALWLVCSDSVTDGNTGQNYTDCQTSNGQFVSGTQFEGVGGTSASAPAFAGMLALVSQSQGGARLGQANGVIYQLAKAKYSTVFHDVTVGNNSVPCAAGSSNCGTNNFLTGYNAGTGFDLATGLGSIDIKQLIQNWSSVSLTSTTTSLTINGSTAAYSGVHGASLTFGVGVNPTAATGAVAIIDTANVTAGGTTSGPQSNAQFDVALTGGAGTGKWNGLPGGTYTVSARYGGDTSDAASTSTPISVTIGAEASTTALEVNATDPLTGNSIGLSSIPYGSQTVLDAQITGTAEGSATQGVATGTVTYLNGSSTLGTASVSGNGNLASWPPVTDSFVALAPATYNVTASYAGDASFKASVSAARAFTIVPAVTTLSAQASLGSITTAQATNISFTITSLENLGAFPGGSVQLTANGKTLATFSSFGKTIVLQGGLPYYELTGSVTVQGSQLAPGTANVITLAYAGDPNYATASTTVSVTVTGGVGSISLTNSGSITVPVGGMGSSTLTVTPAGGYTGTVNFSCSVSGAPSITCAAAAAKVTGTGAAMAMLTAQTSASTAPNTYTATVTGTDSVTGTITAMTTLSIIVTQPTTPTLFLANSGPITVVAGATSGNTSTITVTPAGGFTGQVNLTCAVGNSPGGTNPTCTVTSPVSIAGTSAATSTLTIVTSGQTTAGSYTFNVNAADAATGTITASTSVPVTVTAAAGIALTSSGNVAVNPGGTPDVTITVTPNGGFTGVVKLSCAVTTSVSSPNDEPSCSLPSTLTISGTTAVTTTLTIFTTAATAGTLDLPLKRFILAGGGGALALVLFFGIPARRRAWRVLFTLLAALIVVGTIGCSGGSTMSGGGGGGGNAGTTPGVYTITVNGTDATTGKITGSVAVMLTVN